MGVVLRRGMLLTLVVLGGCYGVPPGSRLDIPGAARPEYRTPKGLSLAEKAARFEALTDRFIAPEGMLVYCQPGYDKPFHYANLSDEPIWTGSLLGAEAMRYAATGETAALERVRTLARGLHTLQAATGVPGVLARSVWRNGTVPAIPGRERPAGGAFAKTHSLRGDVSKDELSGTLFGWTFAALLSGDPAVRRQITDDVRAFAARLIEHDYSLVDVDGEETTYGNCRGRIFGVPIGLNALICLVTTKLAWRLTGEARFGRAYLELVDAGYPEIAYWGKIQLFHKTNHNNDNMHLLVASAYLALEPDEARRRPVIEGMERTWWYVRYEGNSWFNYALMGAFGYDRQGARDARLQLERFPLERRRLGFDLSDDPRFPHALFSNRKGEPTGLYAMPITYRTITSNVWKSCPYSLDEQSVDEEEICAPIDYLLAYYAGLYWGFLPPKLRSR